VSCLDRRSSEARRPRLPKLWLTSKRTEMLSSIHMPPIRMVATRTSNWQQRHPPLRQKLWKTNSLPSNNASLRSVSVSVPLPLYCLISRLPLLSCLASRLVNPLPLPHPCLVMPCKRSQRRIMCRPVCAVLRVPSCVCRVCGRAASTRARTCTRKWSSRWWRWHGLVAWTAWTGCVD